jgi:hypothetical protein
MYTKRVGDPLVTYSYWQAGIYVQDDWRARKNLTVSAGVRQEAQTHLHDGWNPAPRAGFTWSPFRDGKTTIRGGGGIFYDWLDRDAFEQTLRVDGVRQQDVIVRNPGYPDPFYGTSGEDVLPTSRFLLDPNLAMPRRFLVTFGATRMLSANATLNLSYNHSHGSNRPRGRNVNAPLASGLRPDPSRGNVIQVESTASVRSDSVATAFSFNLPQRRTLLFASYVWMRQMNDADGPFSLPANSYDLGPEWGPAAGVSRHNVSGMFNTALPFNIRLGLSATARSGAPYNVTTGRDDNGDTVFTDRPAGVGRNSAVGPGMWDVAARVSYAFGFGQRSAAGGGGPQVMVVQRGGGGGASDMLGMLQGGGAENKRVRFELFAAASNLFNHVNQLGVSGVMSSPFFGRATAAAPPRRIELGARLGF